MNTQDRMISICNPEMNPETNGIETTWAVAKQKFRKRLTAERLKKPFDYTTYDIVTNVLDELPASTIHNCAAHGWRALFNDQRNRIKVTKFQNNNFSQWLSLFQSKSFVPDDFIIDCLRDDCNWPIEMRPIGYSSATAISLIFLPFFSWLIW